MEENKAAALSVSEPASAGDKLNELIEKGKKKGKLSSNELMEVLEDMDLESDQFLTGEESLPHLFTTTIPVSSQ